MTGEIVLVPFPFAELTSIKIRPAVVVCVTKDGRQDITVCSISSVLPQRPLSSNEILLSPDSVNNLRTKSVLKVDRISTLREYKIVSRVGKLNDADFMRFKEVFQHLIE